jgi:ElaB/YqjD/DUF883 family membrane-anchored ribosome-binding protein
MVRDNETNAIGGEGVPEGLLASPDLRDRANSRTAHLVDRVRDIPEVANRANETFVEFVREQPLVALGAACAVGYVLGRILRRVV